MTPPDETAAMFELLDAYADDELTESERAAVRALLDESATARAQLADIERVRSLVRGLPDVDPPFGFYERLRLGRDRPARRRMPGVLVAAVGAVAAAVVLVVAITPTGDRLSPPVDDLSRRHTMLASSLASSSHEMPAGYEAMPVDELDSMQPFEAPATTEHGYRRVAAYRAPEGVHVLYRSEAATVSVFEQRGRVRWDGLPTGGTRLRMDGDDAWTATMANRAGGSATDVVVLARDDLVVTVIGSASHDDVMAVAEAVPNPPTPSVSERVGNACDWITEGFGFPA